MKKRFVLFGMDHPHYKMIIDAVRSRNDMELTAIAQETFPFADELAATLGVKCYRNYLEALDAERPDIAGVAMYNGIRGGFIYECVSRNIPVIADKPLCLSLAELERIKNAFEKTNAPLCMMLTCRSNPAYRAMKKAVEEGLIGEVLSIDAVRYYALNRPSRPDWMFDRQSYGGPGIDILIHDYDLARWITGLDWKDISMNEYCSGQIADKDFSDSAEISSREGCTSLSLKMFWNSPKGHWDRFAIFGTKGFLEKRFSDGKVLYVNENGVADYLLPESSSESFADWFFNALFDGASALPVSGEDSLLVTERLIKASMG